MIKPQIGSGGPPGAAGTTTVSPRKPPARSGQAPVNDRFHPPLIIPLYWWSSTEEMQQPKTSSGQVEGREQVMALALVPGEGRVSPMIRGRLPHLMWHYLGQAIPSAALVLAMLPVRSRENFTAARQHERDRWWGLERQRDFRDIRGDGGREIGRRRISGETLRMDKRRPDAYGDLGGRGQATHGQNDALKEISAVTSYPVAIDELRNDNHWHARTILRWRTGNGV